MKKLFSAGPAKPLVRLLAVGAFLAVQIALPMAVLHSQDLAPGKGASLQAPAYSFRPMGAEVILSQAKLHPHYWTQEPLASQFNRRFVAPLREPKILTPRKTAIAMLGE